MACLASHEYKESTGDEYQRKLRLHAFSDIGNLRLDEINKRVLHSLFDNLAIKGLSNSTMLKRIRIHDLRHTDATIRLLRGHNIGDVSYQLGHSSIKITYDLYGHWIPGKFKSEVDELDQAPALQNVEKGAPGVQNKSK